MTAESAYLCGNFEQMEQWIEVVQQQAQNLIDRVKIYEIKIQALAAQNQLIQAVKTGLEILQALGVCFPENPDESESQKALEEIDSLIAGRKIEQLVELPEMKAPEQLAAMQLLSSLMAPVYQGMPQMLSLVVFKMVTLSLQHGNTGISAFAYAMHGLILCGILGDIEGGYQIGQLAMKLIEKFNARQIECRTGFVFNISIRYWKRHGIGTGDRASNCGRKTQWLNRSKLNARSGI